MFRSLLMASKLPYKRKLKYLESTGTQWIDANTGDIDDTWGYQAETSQPDRGVTSGEAYIIGSSITLRQRFFSFGDYHTYWTFGWGARQSNFIGLDNTTTFERYPIGSDNYYVHSLNFMDDNTARFSDFSMNLSWEWGSGTTNTTIKLFASFGSTLCQGRIKWCKISHGSEIVRDFIPVLDWNDVPCMYDKVSKQRFYNKGTGSFNYA